jgi:GNAT superfamily N-acetyltransferase
MAANGSAVVLRTGETVRIRRLTGNDRAPLRRFLEGFGRESLATRFFGAVTVEAILEPMLDLSDAASRRALVLTSADGATILAQAEYLRDRPGSDRAEVAFLVSEALQGRGCATLLLKALAAEAVAEGIREFHAEVLADNDRMLEVFRDAGFPYHPHFVAGAIEVRLDLAGPKGVRGSSAPPSAVAA